MLRDITVQRPLRNRHTVTSEQLTHLHHRHRFAMPALQPVMHPDRDLPTTTMTIRAMLHQPQHHHADEHVVELTVATIAFQTLLNRDLDDPPNRLAIRPNHRLDRSIATTRKPQPQHFTHLIHRDLPERHSAPPPSWSVGRQGG